MQTDPIGYDDGMNWYAYVGNDPVNMRDPTGNAACGGLCIAAAAAVKCATNAGCRKAVVETTKSITKKVKKKYFTKKQKQKRHDEVDGKCEYCGKDTQMDEPFKKNSAEGDHIKPASKGGDRSPENQANSCRGCNNEKSNKELGTEYMPKNPNERIQKIVEENLKNGKQG